MDAPYREAPLREVEQTFSFERDSRHLFAGIRRRIWAWRIFWCVASLIFGSMMVAAREPATLYVPIYLGLAVGAGWLIATLGKFGNNGFWFVNSDSLAQLASDRIWAFTSKQVGMVIFTADTVFIERPPRTFALDMSIGRAPCWLALKDLSTLEYAWNSHTIHLAWCYQRTYGDNSDGVSSEGDLRLAVPDTTSQDEAHEKVLEVKERARSRAQADGRPSTSVPSN